MPLQIPEIRPGFGVNPAYGRIYKKSQIRCTPSQNKSDVVLLRSTPSHSSVSLVSHRRCSHQSSLLCAVSWHLRWQWPFLQNACVEDRIQLLFIPEADTQYSTLHSTVRSQIPPYGSRFFSSGLWKCHSYRTSKSPAETTAGRPERLCSTALLSRFRRSFCSPHEGIGLAQISRSHRLQHGLPHPSLSPW